MTACETSPPALLTGGCQCGAVRYTVAAPPPTAHTACHCRTCQRLSGSAFLPFVHFPASAVTWLGDASAGAGAGADGAPLRAFRVSRFAERRFCGACGSPLSMAYDALPGHVSLVAGSLDGADALPRLTQHIYLGERAPWFDVPGAEGDGVERHETMEGADQLLGGAEAG